MEHQECVICFDKLANGAVCALFGSDGKRSCRHYFHRECMIGGRDGLPECVLMTRRECPCCRAKWTTAVTLPNPIVDPRAFFDCIDADHGGCLSKSEVIDGLKATVDLDWRQIDSSVDALWSTWDRDGNGSISYEEMTAPRSGLLDYIRRNYPGQRLPESPNILQQPRQWFQYWDEDSSNSLEKDEIVRALIKTFRVTQGTVEVSTIRETLDCVFPIFDDDGSGAIDIDEFTKTDGLCDTIIASMAAYGP